MKTKSLIIVLTLSIALLSVSCRDKKKTETNTDTEVISEQSKTATDNAIDKEEKRRLDSIRQVKEHGHAH